MTEQEWLTCTDPQTMLEFLRGKASERKLRLFAIACCLSVCHLAARQEFRIACLNALQVGERFVDGQVGSEELLEAWREFHYLDRQVKGLKLSKPEHHLKVAVLNATQAGWEERNTQGAASNAMQAMRVKNGRKTKWQEWVFQCHLLHCIFGNPLHPSPPLPPSVLAWNDGTVRRIAEGIYEERRMPEGTLDTGRLAILADALLDAGCDDEDLIQHCREVGSHVRGCWLLDLILGKK